MASPGFVLVIIYSLLLSLSVSDSAVGQPVAFLTSSPKVPVSIPGVGQEFLSRKNLTFRIQPDP